MRNGTLKYLLGNFRKRHRLSMSDSDGNEVWYSYFTAVKMTGWIVFGALAVFIATLLIAAYTKVLDIVPGYQGIRSREQMVENIVRLDSLERELRYMTVYTDNVAQIMEGRAPVIRSMKPQDEDKITSDKSIIPPSEADLILRGKLEGTGRYALSAAQQADKEKFQNLELLRPVQGQVTLRFSPADLRYGTTVTVSDIQQVAAVQDGTVISDIWEPDGYTVQVQHSGNFISIYKGLGQSHKKVGDRVKAGEAIGVTWNEDTSSGNATEVEIQLWYDGKPINPEQYISFQ